MSRCNALRSKEELHEYLQEEHIQQKFDEIEQKYQRQHEVSKHMDDLKVNDDQKQQYRNRLNEVYFHDYRISTRHYTVNDFDTLAIIGRGAYAEVRLVRLQDSNEIFAMKVMEKFDLIRKNQVRHIREERKLLGIADNPWLVKLHFSFQDDEHLYLVMDYLPGGDLMSILSKYDVLTEKQAKFYVAEVAVAIKTIHKLQYVHRDLKPDNILIGKDGHVKLIDFGLCKEFEPKTELPLTLQKQISEMIIINEDILSDDEDEFSQTGFKIAVDDADEPGVVPTFEEGGEEMDFTDFLTLGELFQNRKYSAAYEDGTEKKHNEELPPPVQLPPKNPSFRARLHSVVGTPDYIAPEVFGTTGYGFECDWWSLGVMMYEFLCGYPCFYSDDQERTCKKIVNWKSNLMFPPDLGLSDQAIDVIKSLVCNAEDRFTFDELKAHTFFEGIDWDNIRETRAPIIPDVKHEADVGNFEKFNPLPHTPKPGEDLPSPVAARRIFRGFTFKRKMTPVKKRGIENIFADMDDH